MHDRHQKNNIIQLVFNLNNMLIIHSPASNYRESMRLYRQQFPAPWDKYCHRHTITITHEKKYHSCILLPGVLEMLCYFLVYLKKHLYVSFLITERNGVEAKLIEEIKIKIAQQMNLALKKINFSILTLKSDTQNQNAKELNPLVENNSILTPHSLQQSVNKNIFNILPTLFAENMPNVVFVYDGYDLPEDLATHQLKISKCISFSMSDLLKYCKSIDQDYEPLKNNLSYLHEPSFYSIQQALYITSVISHIIDRVNTTKCTAKHALVTLQTCSQTNRYHYQIKKPFYDRYDFRCYHEGYELLAKISPKLKLFLPYRDHIRESLELMSQACDSTRYAIAKATNYCFNMDICETILRYIQRGPDIVEDILSKQGMFSANANANAKPNKNIDANKTPISSCVLL